MAFRSLVKTRSPQRRRLFVEALETRQLLASVPYGAMPDDTGEYLLGDVVVTVVLMDSNSSLAPRDPSTESNWSSQEIQDVKTKVEAGFDWWKSLLAQKSVAMAADLNFHVDYTYADTPVQTGYEPINRISNDFYIASASGPPNGWMYDFLKQVGYTQTGDFSSDLRAYNNARRLAGTAAHPGPADWAFTIFVVNSTLDGDDAFAPGGSFARAFSFPGGRMIIVPSGRPAYTYTHEMAHQFWGLDEYSGSNHLARRGYYNSQNSNAARAGYTQEPSIMTSADLLLAAWETPQLQSTATLEILGWRDSDSDGIFDVLDVPFELTGTGYYDPSAGKYHFQGESRVRTLPNLNTSGLMNDITINEITRAEYRINGGVWQTAASYGASSVTLNLEFAVPPTATTVEIRTIDAVIPGSGGTGASSPIFQADLTKPNATTESGINGFVWNDLDGDGVFETGEPGLPGWTLQLVNAGGQVLPLLAGYDPDSYAEGTLLNSANPAVTLSALGFGTDGSVGALTSSIRSTGSRVFGVNDSAIDSWTTTWDGTNRNLRMRFASPVNHVSLDAIGNSAGDYGRLEAYDANDNLLARYTTDPLTSGQVETMSIDRATAEIAYVKAKGHAGSDVLLDNLKYGAEPTTKAGTFGEYALNYLPAGTYTVRAIPPTSFMPTGALPADKTITVSAGEVRQHFDFAARGVNNPWQNAGNQFDVNNDTFVSPIDALFVINDLNGNGSRQLPSPGIGPQSAPPFLDVNGDGFVAPVDALLVINRLNSGGAGESSDAASGSGAARGGSSSGSQAGPNGEDLMSVVSQAVASAKVQEVSSGFQRFTARNRFVAEPVVMAANQPLSAAFAATIDDALAADVYRAWVKSRDAAADLEELEHDHSDLDHDHEFA